MNRNILLIVVALVGIGLCVFLFRNKASMVPPDNTDSRTITDLVGRSVTLKKDIRRVILLRSKDIYQLAALLGDDLPLKLIAWGPDLKDDDQEGYRKFVEVYPALKELPETGSIYTDALNVEQLLSLEPDLVIADKFIRDRGYKYVAHLEASGLPVVYLDGSNDPLTGPQKGMALLGEILGKAPRAIEIVGYVNEQLDLVQQKLNAVGVPKPSVYLEQGVTGVAAYGPTYGRVGDPAQYISWGMVLHKLRVNNIAEGIAGLQEPINPEFLLKADPEVIVITGQNWSVPGAMRLGYYVNAEDAEKGLWAYTRRPGWADLRAIKNKRLYSVFHNTAVITCFASVQALAKDVYPAQFSDLDPEQSLKTFYTRFMPIAYSGTWMVSPKP